MPCFHCSHDAQLAGLLRADGRMPFAEPGVEPHFAPSRSMDIARYDLSLSLEPEGKRWSGTARIDVVPLARHDGTLVLALDEVAVDAVSRGGEALSWSHDDAKLTIRGVTGACTVEIRFHGESPRAGLYFTGPTAQRPTRQHMAWTQCQDEDAHFVFPCLDHPGVKHPWSIRLDAPEGYTLLSNGRRLDEGVADGRAWATFEQAEPMPAYLFTAVAARLSVVEADGPVPVRYLVPVGEEEAIERAFGKTPDMIRLFAEKTGTSYPWPRYDQVVVHDFIFGGMENTGCTTMTDVLLVDEKGCLEWEPDGLVAHELAHQWFGDLVTCRDWSQAWLNESWATFMETVWCEHHKSRADATWYRFGQAENYLDEDGGRYRRPIVSYDFREPIDVFDRHLYEKGACVLSTLRFELGEDAFWQGVRRYLADNGYKPVHTRDFQKSLEDVTGANLDRFFQQWVHRGGHPVMEVALSEEKGLLLVSVRQTQSAEGSSEVFHLPLRIEVETASGSRTIELPVRERERTFAVPVDGEIAGVRVDPDFRLLAEIKLKGPRKWLTRLLADPCPVLAVRAAKALVDEGSKPARDAVIAAMSAHPFHGVRGRLASMLGRVRGDAVRDALIAALGGESDPRVTRQIVSALGTYRDEAAADAILGVLSGELPTWQLHGAALAALGATRDARAVQAIVPHLGVDSWAEQVRAGALNGLAATYDAAVLDTLIAWTRPDKEARVRAAAAGALAALAQRVESVRDQVRERLEAMVDEPGFREQLAAMKALGDLKDARSIGVLSRVHRSAPDGRTRRLAYEAKVRIEEGRTAALGLEALRTRVDSLAEENAKLRGRLEKLEKLGES